MAALARLFRGDEPDDAAAETVFAFSLPVGLVAAALPGWLVSGFLRETPIRVLALPLAGLALVALLLWGGRDLLGVLARLRALAAPLVLFLAVFGLFLWIRATFGEIRQTEKPMDFAVLSGLMATPRLPFMDPWLAGARFPYYHFGTYLFALPARAARVPSEYAYNLVAALLPALAALAAYGAVRTRGGGRRLALLAGSVLVLGRNVRRRAAGARREAPRPTSTGGSPRGASTTRDHGVAALHVPARRPPPARRHVPVLRRVRRPRGPDRDGWGGRSSTESFSRPSSPRIRGTCPRASSSSPPATSPSARSAPRP